MIEQEEQIPVGNNDQDDDVRRVEEFACKCTQATGNVPCSSLFETEELLAMRQEARALDYYDQDHCNRLDLVILGQLRALCSSSIQTNRSHQQNASERKRTRTTYRIKGHVVCKDTFFFCIRNLENAVQTTVENLLC